MLGLAVRFLKVCFLPRLHGTLVYFGVFLSVWQWPPGVKMKISTKEVKSGMYTIWLVYHFVSILT